MGKGEPIAVLHLTPHAGGGVGAVLRAMIRASNGVGGVRHTLASLDSLNPLTRQWCAENGVDYLENAFHDRPALFFLLDHSDVVHIHWWNHPLLHAFLALPSLPPMRTVLWAHVNGMHVPQIFFQPIVDFPDFFVLATPYSKESPLFSGRDVELAGKLRVIQSNAGVPEGAPAQITKPDGFTAGYIGTVDYSKMHPDFVSIWVEAAIDEAPLIVCGGLAEAALRDEVAARGVAHLFDIRGPVDNVPEVLSSLHLFMYPLISTHYGTGEQVLLEAMAFGAVPVVMDNGCERYIVKDGENGLVAAGKDDFVRALRFLNDNPEVRQRMAAAGREYVSACCGIQRTVSQWHELYGEALQLAKRRHRLGGLRPMAGVADNSTTALMLNSYGDSVEARKLLALLHAAADGKAVDTADLPPALFLKTRGAPRHYHAFLPGDAVLEEICRLLGRLDGGEQS